MGNVKSKSKPKPKRENKGTRMGREILTGLDEVLRYFRGEPNGVKATWVELTPTQLAIRELIDARKEAGMSIPDVAAASGLTAAWIRRLETARINSPTVDALSKYARAVGRELRMSLQPTGPKRSAASK